MTADRRDWVDVVCEECDWGVRVPPSQASAAGSAHTHTHHSLEEKTPTACSMCGKTENHNPCAIASCPLRASVSPSNEEIPYPPPPGHIFKVDDIRDLPYEVMQYDSGVRRTPNEGKINWALALDGPLIKRFARHLTEGVKSKGKRNWMKGNTEEDLERFRESAVRHFMQWYAGETDEDHFAATLFNMNGAELTKEKREERWPVDPEAEGYR